MYINDINILYYLGIGILGLFIGQFIDWCDKRLPEYKKVFSKEFFTVYLKEAKPKYLLMVTNAVMYVGLLYFFGFSIDTLKFMFLVPMLISAFVIDYRLQIIPNRLTLTIFETGLIFTFTSVMINTNAGINIFTNNMLGLIVGGGIFLIITLIGGLIAGKDAMGFGDVKLMGALGLFFGWMNIIMVAVMAFLLAAVISIIILVSRKKKADEYIPFGPFIVISAIIAIFVPSALLLTILFKIFTLGLYKG